MGEHKHLSVLLVLLFALVLGLVIGGVPGSGDYVDAQNADPNCWLSDGGTSDDCTEKSNAQKSAEYADSYNDDCSGWRGWLWPSCWWSN